MTGAPVVPWSRRERGEKYGTAEGFEVSLEGDDDGCEHINKPTKTDYCVLQLG